MSKPVILAVVVKRGWNFRFTVNVVGKVLDVLGIEHALFERWGSE